MSYLIFAYHTNYPAGARLDYRASFSDLVAATEKAKEMLEDFPFVDLFCLSEREIISYKSGSRNPEPTVYTITEHGAFKK